MDQQKIILFPRPLFCAGWSLDQFAYECKREPGPETRNNTKSIRPAVICVCLRIPASEQKQRASSNQRTPPGAHLAHSRLGSEGGLGSAVARSSPPLALLIVWSCAARCGLRVMLRPSAMRCCWSSASAICRVRWVKKASAPSPERPSPPQCPGAVSSSSPRGPLRWVPAAQCPAPASPSAVAVRA